jgi:predicted  nucleic acid-binding Zn-ribbon protein
MIEGMQGLVELSRLDTELAAREREKTALPQKREECAETRQACEARLEAARVALTEAEQAQRRAEADARDQEALLSKLEGQQHQVKTNEAYTALLHEMDAAREAISGAETLILEAMEAIEAGAAERSDAEEEVRVTLARVEADEKTIDERERVLEREIAELRSRRQEVGQGLAAELLQRYERIAARRSPAIAIVTRETCMGCRVGIPPQNCIEILRGESVVTCGNCQRILIHEEHLGASTAP